MLLSEIFWPEAVGEDGHDQAGLAGVHGDLREGVAGADGKEGHRLVLELLDQLVAFRDEFLAGRSATLEEVEDDDTAFQITELVILAVAEQAGREIGGIIACLSLAHRVAVPEHEDAAKKQGRS